MKFEYILSFTIDDDAEQRVAGPEIHTLHLTIAWQVNEQLRAWLATNPLGLRDKSDLDFRLVLDRLPALNDDRLADLTADLEAGARRCEELASDLRTMVRIAQQRPPTR